MTKNEARRYAHKLVADVVEDAYVTAGGLDGESRDGKRIVIALREIRESHLRFGPRTTDRPPTLPPPTPPTPLLDALDTSTETHQ